MINAPKKLLTERQAFTLIKKHLLKQNKKCIDSEENCLYKGESNMKCAIGVLIPDSSYNKNIENKCASSDEVWAILRHVVEENLSIKILFDDIQDIHDNFEPQHWELMMEDLLEEESNVGARPRGWKSKKEGAN